MLSSRFLWPFDVYNGSTVQCQPQHFLRFPMFAMLVVISHITDLRLRLLRFRSPLDGNCDDKKESPRVHTFAVLVAIESASAIQESERASTHRPCCLLSYCWRSDVSAEKPRVTGQKVRSSLRAAGLCGRNGAIEHLRRHSTSFKESHSFSQSGHSPYGHTRRRVSSIGGHVGVSSYPSEIANRWHIRFQIRAKTKRLDLGSPFSITR
jgi:hypothetical protein